MYDRNLNLNIHFYTLFRHCYALSNTLSDPSKIRPTCSTYYCRNKRSVVWPHNICFLYIIKLMATTNNNSKRTSIKNIQCKKFYVYIIIFKKALEIIEKYRILTLTGK